MLRRSSVSLLVVAILCLPAACVDKAQPDYAKCVQADTAGDFQRAWDACKRAIATDPESTSGRAAAAKLAEPKFVAWKKSEDERSARAQAATNAERAREEKSRWQTAPTKLAHKLREQGMWDLGRGTVTPAIDVITGEIGQPTGSYETAYGSILIYVWGVQFGTPPSADDLKRAPFSARMLRNMPSGDYAPNTIEFSSYGERIWPE
jgi:hypothetical protein